MVIWFNPSVETGFLTPPLTFPTVAPTGGAAEAELERALHPERSSVFFAHTHGSSTGSCWIPLRAHVGGAGRVLHGPGQGFPGPGGQAEPAAGGHGRVQLPQSHRALLSWCATVPLGPVNCGKCQELQHLLCCPQQMRVVLPTRPTWSRCRRRPRWP